MNQLSSSRKSENNFDHLFKDRWRLESSLDGPRWQIEEVIRFFFFFFFLEKHLQGSKYPYVYLCIIFLISHFFIKNSVRADRLRRREWQAQQV